MFHSVHFNRPTDPPSVSSDCLARLNQVIDLVCREHNVTRYAVLSPSRGRLRVARARQMAMYLSHVAFGQSLTAVGLAFGRDRTTVSYACGLVEDLRDDPEIDRDLDRLEALLNRVHA